MPNSMKHITEKEIPDPTQTFGHFMQHYLRAIACAGYSRMRDELVANLEAMMNDPATPRYCVDMAQTQKPGQKQPEKV